jgi:hypothetical protein
MAVAPWVTGFADQGHAQAAFRRRGACLKFRKANEINMLFQAAAF